MKRLLCIISVSAFMCCYVNAQFHITKKENATEVKKRPLLVVLQEEDQEISKKFKLSGTDKSDAMQQQYLDGIEGYNIAIKYAIENFWTFSNKDKVEFINENDPGLADKIKSGKYAVLRYGKIIDLEYYRSRSEGEFGGPAGWSKDLSTGAMIYNKGARYTVIANVISTMEVQLGKKTVTKVNMPNMEPSKGDVVYALQQTQYILRFLNAGNSIIKILGQIKRNAPGLKKKTLLIDKNEVDKNLTKEAIDAIYPYPYKLVDYDEMEQAILSADQQYAYVQIVATNNGKGTAFTQYVSGAKDGKIYGAFMPKVAVGIKGLKVFKYNNRIKEKHFKNFAKNVE